MSTRPFPGPRPDTALQQVQMNPEPMGVSEWAGRVTERKRERASVRTSFSVRLGVVVLFVSVREVRFAFR